MAPHWTESRAKTPFDPDALAAAIAHHMQARAPEEAAPKSDAELRALLLSMPYVRVPDEVGSLLDLKPAAVYALVKERAFPTFQIGRTRFARTRDVLCYVDALATTTSAPK